MEIKSSNIVVKHFYLFILSKCFIVVLHKDIVEIVIVLYDLKEGSCILSTFMGSVTFIFYSRNK